MMPRSYDAAKAGRQVYISAKGVELERKFLYANSQEWEDLQNLARTLGQPVGRMLVLLAYAEIEKIRKSIYVPPPPPQLHHASQR